jgi:hypothetical protein
MQVASLCYLISFISRALPTDPGSDLICGRSYHGAGRQTGLLIRIRVHPQPGRSLRPDKARCWLEPPELQCRIIGAG